MKRDWHEDLVARAKVALVNACTFHDSYVRTVLHMFGRFAMMHAERPMWVRTEEKSW